MMMRIGLTAHRPPPPQRRRRGHVPAGCSVQSGGDWAVHFNSGGVRGSRDIYTVVSAPYYPAPNTMLDMKDAKMSSELQGGFPAAHCLTDGGTWSSMCHAAAELQPWWQASTADGGKHTITAVVVRNRGDCIGACASPRPVTRNLERATAASLVDRADMSRACAPSRPREGLCTDRFGKYRVFIDGVERASGDAKGQLGYLRIPMPEGTVGSLVKLQLENSVADYLNLQYIGVEGTRVP